MAAAADGCCLLLVVLAAAWVVVAVVLDAGRWWYGWVLHWDNVQAGCCMDRTGLMFRWWCAVKMGLARGSPSVVQNGTAVT